MALYNIEFYLVLICPILKIQNNSNNPTANQGSATSESNNLPIARPSSGSAFGKPKGSSSSKNIQFEQPFLVRTTAAAKANLELLAQNRGNAMQRYKEKKKTRRYIHIRHFCCHLAICLSDCVISEVLIHASHG